MYTIYCFSPLTTSVLLCLAFQELEQISRGLDPLPHQMLNLILASLNALLWIAMIVIAFVQVWDPTPHPPPTPKWDVSTLDLSMQSLYMFFCAGLQSDWCRTRAQEECGEQKVASLPIHCLSAVGFGQLCLVHSSCEAQGR